MRRKVCACLRYTSLRQLFNISLHWFVLKFVKKCIQIINKCVLTVVAVSVGEGCECVCVGDTHNPVTDFIPQQ